MLSENLFIYFFELLFFKEYTQCVYGNWTQNISGRKLAEMQKKLKDSCCTLNILIISVLRLVVMCSVVIVQDSLCERRWPTDYLQN